MKVILDTNVLISGIFWGGQPAKILNLWKQSKLIFLLSPEIMEEYRKVANEIASKYKIEDLDSILDSILAASEIYAANELPEQVCEDQDDDKFIACAIAGKAKYIITGDRLLLKVKEHNKVKIIKPAEFVKKYFNS